MFTSCKHVHTVDLRKYTTLLGTASALTIASTFGAQAQPAEAGAAIEEVLVTGSLIAGSTAIGVPVTALSSKDFSETGAVTLADVIRQFPGITSVPLTGATNHGYAEANSNIDIHGLNGTKQNPRDLLMVDGVRVPASGHNQSWLDPTFIPTLAVQRVDVLADGASATYGSDAVAGVVNVILLRGYDGAKTMVRYGRFKSGGDSYQADAIWGRTWDGGDITLTYEWFDQGAIPGGKQDKYTMDFTPWGLDDRTPTAASIPGVVSIGKPNSATSTSCTNCFSIPTGQNGVGLTWVTILTHPGVTNLKNPYIYNNLLQAQQHNAAVITLDQRLFPGVSFFLDGYYSNRRVANIQSVVAKNVFKTYTVPTNNPYYPVGAPAGLQWTGNTNLETIPRLSAKGIDGRYNFGVNLDLPHDWTGKVYMSDTTNLSVVHEVGLGHAQAVQVALGQTNPASGAFAAWSKPANIPYLNVFCDPIAFRNCNYQSTLDFINGDRLDQGYTNLAEKGANFSGPLFALPAGDVKAAIGGTYTSYRLTNYQTNTYLSITNTPSVINLEAGHTWWSIFSQVDIPVFSDANAIPLFQKLDFELSWRHDQYSDAGGTSNPKVAFNWQPIGGLTIRGSWGTAFRAPQPKEVDPILGNDTHPFNKAIGEATDTIGVVCKGGVPVPGSAAALTGAACGSFPGGVEVSSASGNAAFLTGGATTLRPEKGTNINIGFEYAPTDFLKGLDIEATYWKIRISDAVASFDVNQDNFNDPNYAFLYYTPATVGGTAAFQKLVDQYFLIATVVTNPTQKTNIQWIENNTNINLGYEIHDGIDYKARYDLDMTDDGFGLWEAGIAGTYYMRNIAHAGITGVPDVDLFHDDIGVGAIAAYGVTVLPRYMYRAHLSWNDGGWSVTGFFNYSSHYYSDQAAPPAAFLAKFPNYSNRAPEYHTFDLSVGYNTGETLENSYLHNINIQFVAKNLLDKSPPWQYALAAPHSAGTGGVVAYDQTYSDTGRLVQLTITKDW